MHNDVVDRTVQLVDGWLAANREKAAAQSGILQGSADQSVCKA
jgi:hypothetical protein